MRYMSFYIIRYLLNDFQSMQMKFINQKCFPMCLTPPQPKRMTKGGLGMKVWTEGWTESRSLLCLLCEEVGLNAACD